MKLIKPFDAAVPTLNMSNIRDNYNTASVKKMFLIFVTKFKSIDKINTCLKTQENTNDKENTFIHKNKSIDNNNQKPENPKL